MKSLSQKKKTGIIVVCLVLFAIMTPFIVSKCIEINKVNNAIMIIKQMKDVKDCKIQIKNDTAYVYVKMYADSRSYNGDYVRKAVYGESIKRVKYVTDLGM